MRSFRGIVVITILLSASNAETYRYDGFNDKHDTFRFYLRHLLNRFQFDEEENLFFRQSVNSPATRCNKIQKGVYYDNIFTAPIDNVQTFEECRDSCEDDKSCYAWAYEESSKLCYLQSSIGAKTTAASYITGSCIGLADKETCKQIIEGSFYEGDSGPRIENVPTVEDCMKKCDDDSTCLAWSHRQNTNTCWLQFSIMGTITAAPYRAGACIKLPSLLPIPIEDFRQQALVQHNLYRDRHCAPRLQLNPEVNVIAQTYAEHLASTGEAVHSTNQYKGQSAQENIWRGGGSLLKEGSVPVYSWYSEIQYYDWSKPGPTEKAGHFTELIWKKTNTLGIGRAISSKTGQMWVVATYVPSGNVDGGYEESVPKLCRKK